MPPKTTLILTVGLPRSGKSTWARTSGFPVVCPDEIRSFVHGSLWFAPAEPLVWWIAKIMVQALFASGSEVVVLDATNNTVARRAEWLDPAWDVRVKYFPTPADVCLRRAAETGRLELHGVIERMSEEHEAPDELPELVTRWL